MRTMQKFTRNLTREVEIAGERLAVTFSAEGLNLRPVGSRRPPQTLSWARLLCAALGPGAEPDGPAVAEALQRLKKPPKEKAARSAGEMAATTAPASDLPGVLARVDQWLHEHRPRIAGTLLPPATSEQLDQAEKQLGRPFPEELRTLLSWHNGQRDDVQGAFERCFFLMSAEQIVEAVRDLTLSPAAPTAWQASWIPFLEDSSDSFVVLDSQQPEAGVRDVWRGQQEHPVVAPTLTDWAGGFLEGLEQGAYVEDPERGTFFRKGSAEPPSRRKNSPPARNKTTQPHGQRLAAEGSPGQSAESQ